MSNFVVVPPYDYIAELLRLAPAFEVSPEFRSLASDERASASLVFSAFAKFFESSFADESAINQCKNTMESFAARNDLQGHNLLVTEVFEGFRYPDLSANLLLPISRALYDRWIVKEGHPP